MATLITVTLTEDEHAALVTMTRRLVEAHRVIKRDRPEMYEVAKHNRATSTLIALHDGKRS